MLGEVSIVLHIERGQRQIADQAARRYPVSFTGRGRPRRMARACSSPQVTATASEYGRITTLPSHPASSARLPGPSCAGPSIWSVRPASRTRCTTSGRSGGPGADRPDAPGRRRTPRRCPGRRSSRQAGPAGRVKVRQELLPLLIRLEQPGRAMSSTDSTGRTPFRRASSSTGTGSSREGCSACSAPCAVTVTSHLRCSLQ